MICSSRILRFVHQIETGDLRLDINRAGFTYPGYTRAASTRKMQTRPDTSQTVSREVRPTRISSCFWWCCQTSNRRTHSMLWPQTQHLVIKHAKQIKIIIFFKFTCWCIFKFINYMYTECFAKSCLWFFPYHTDKTIIFLKCIRFFFII